MNFPAQLHRFTVGEYHRLTHAEILPLAERTELLNGVILTMVAKGQAHASATQRSMRCLLQSCGDRATVRTQDPVTLNDDSEPEPDIAIVQPDPLDYVTHHPQPHEIWLILEIADTSLKYDRGVKALAYAQAGIEDYWVLDLIDRRLHVFRQPATSGYQQELILAETLTVSPIAFPDLEIPIHNLLPPIVPPNETV
ncbi:Uma2 family endonuclease [Alkalinema pantanalense CENA528]|uniref:Uma2 family endonuclease n=1 Tax=Alkalinema pantanalense TaxID=1620705 RepID=UPI003D6F8CF0